MSTVKTAKHKPTPEEQELARKRAQLNLVEAQLTQRELDLATLQAELHMLESEYLRFVGARYAELDDIEALVAELHARLYPGNPEVQQKAIEARKEALQTAEAADDRPQPLAAFAPSETLKKQYREVAKQLHPDLATDPAQRERRHRFMAEVNAAYTAGDESRLQAILHEWHASPESVTGDGIGADLIRVIRQLAQIEDRLSTIDTEVEGIKTTDVYRLREHVQAAAAEGRDLFAEMATEIEGEISSLRQRFIQFIGKR